MDAIVRTNNILVKLAFDLELVQGLDIMKQRYTNTVLSVHLIVNKRCKRCNGQESCYFDIAM